MKFDVQIASLKGTARLEIKTAQEEGAWAAYISFVSGQALDEACLVLGRQGIPHRFTGSSEKEAMERAKDFLQKNHQVIRMIW